MDKGWNERDIERALAWTSAGSLLSRDTLQDMALSVCRALGIRTWPGDVPPPETGPDARLRVAIRKLEEFTPEQYPEWAERGGVYAEFSAENGDLWWAPEDAPPLFSEQALYAILGKEDGRSVLALIRELRSAAGMVDKQYETGTQGQPEGDEDDDDERDDGNRH